MSFKYTSYLVLNYVDTDYKSVEQEYKESCPRSMCVCHCDRLGATTKKPAVNLIRYPAESRTFYFQTASNQMI